MRNILRPFWAILLLSAWSTAHAGFFSSLFGDTQQRSAPVSPAASVDQQVIATPDVRASDYRLGAGDRIGVMVFNEKDLSLEVSLSDAGSFFYPFLGEVYARNLTIGELQGLLTRRLSDGYLIDPKVYVSIIEYRPFFVNGEVAKPGGYPYQPGLTVRKAISLAGGLTARASLNKLFVIHEDDPSGQPRLTSLNNLLRPGDILTIDQSFF